MNIARHKGRGVSRRVEAGLRRGRSPVPRWTRTRESSLSRLAMWLWEGSLDNEVNCHGWVADGCGSQRGGRISKLTTWLASRAAGAGDDSSRSPGVTGLSLSLSLRGLRAKDLFRPGTIRRAAVQLLRRTKLDSVNSINRNGWAGQGHGRLRNHGSWECTDVFLGT